MSLCIFFFKASLSTSILGFSSVNCQDENQLTSLDFNFVNPISRRVNRVNAPFQWKNCNYNPKSNDSEMNKTKSLLDAIIRSVLH